MAQMYFYYSAMNAGKSTTLLQSSFNYRERGMTPLIFTAAIDDRYGKGVIKARLGIEQEATVVTDKTNLYKYVSDLNEWPDCILFDEAQFLTKKQVIELTDIVDKLAIPIICYGLRSDYRAEPFVGSTYLMLYADTIEELKTICKCGKKASMNLRVLDGVPVFEGQQINIGGNESYIAVCRKHFKQAMEEKHYSERLE